MWHLIKPSSMLHPGLLVDRLLIQVHILPPRFVTSAESQATLPVFALRPELLHPSPRSLLSMVSHHVRWSVPSQLPLNMDVCIMSQLKPLMVIQMSFLAHSSLIVTQHQFYSILERLIPSFPKVMPACTTYHFVICPPHYSFKLLDPNGKLLV